MVRLAAGAHQRAVTAELIEWGRKYSQVHDDASAIRAAEMVSYMSTYYVPGNEYRATKKIEEELQKARDSSIDQIIVALELYTGQRHGRDHRGWSKWAHSQKRSRHVRREPCRPPGPGLGGSTGGESSVSAR